MKKYTQQLPCHFYHTSVCNFNPCPYSHAGEPTGQCVNDSCAICFKQYSQYTLNQTVHQPFPYDLQKNDQEIQQQDKNQKQISKIQKKSAQISDEEQEEVLSTNESSTSNNRIHLPPSDYIQFMLPYRRPKVLYNNTNNPQANILNNQNFNNDIFNSHYLFQQPIYDDFSYLQSANQTKKRSLTPTKKQNKNEYDQRKVQSDNDQWSCISCGFEQNSLTIHSCRQCLVPKINKRLNTDPIISQHEQILDYIFVIDFECTCMEDNSLEIMEIIEFPIIIIDAQRREIVDTFSSYVKPTINPELSAFCTKLTGITQEQVNKANTIDKVLKAVDFFLQPYLKYNVAVLNDCNSDMKQFLLRETESKKIKLPEYFKQFINLKKVFPIIENKRVKDLDQMLKVLNMSFKGKKHSGIQDSKNIAKVVIELLNRGYNFTTRLTESIYPYGQTQGNQQYKYLLLIALQANFKNSKGISEVGAVIVNLHQNQVIWTHIFHHHVDRKSLNEKQSYQKLLEELENNVIQKTELKNEPFLVATMGRKQMDLMKFEFMRLKIDMPKYFDCYINLKKQIPELRKKKEKKALNNSYLIEDAMKLLDIPINNKSCNEQISSSLMDAMNLAQVARKLVIKGYIFTQDAKF